MVGYAQARPASATLPSTCGDIPAARPGGRQPNAVPIIYDMVNVLAVGTIGDSVLLPPALAGVSVMVSNRAALSMQVFGRDLDTINGNPASMGIAHGGGLGGLYCCGMTGAWTRFLQG
jgi:hypothetical protein